MVLVVPEWSPVEMPATVLPHGRRCKLSQDQAAEVAASLVGTAGARLVLAFRDDGSAPR
jgi:hypothetical protein